MGKLEFNQEVGLHNKFHIVVTDVKTGKVTQEAWAYNLILNQAFEKIFNNFKYYNGTGTKAARRQMMRPFEDSTDGASGRFGGYVQVGTGTGNLSALRSELFTYHKGYYGGFYGSGWSNENQTGYYTLAVTIPMGEQYAGPITEVGLASYSSKEYLSTHALLEDSEGKQVYLYIGPNDSVSIYATTFISLSKLTPGTNVGFVGGGTNLFKHVFVDNQHIIFNKDSRYNISLGKCPKKIDGSDGAVISQISSKDVPYNSTVVTFDDVFKAMIFDGIRFDATEGNSEQGIREIGLTWHSQPVFRSIMPVSSVWTGKNIEDEEMGTGDGEEDVFCSVWMGIVPDSEKLYVQGRTPELQVRGTDYSYNNISVPVGENIGKHNYGVEGAGGAVTNINNSADGNTGNYTSIVAEELSGNSYTSEPRLTFYYPSTNYTNKLRVYQGATENYSIRAFRFQGSNDLENWITVTTGDLTNSAGWKELSFPEVGYQYWRFIVDSSWGTSATVRIYELEWLQTRPQIKFTVPPASGAAITANYRVDYIPKDVNHVLDISFTLSFKDANAE